MKLDGHMGVSKHPTQHFRQHTQVNSSASRTTSQQFDIAHYSNLIFQSTHITL